jgi:glycogen debranching enzyme
VTLRILEGSNFCLCDDRGDFVDATHGFFTQDTRFLARLNLTLNGKRPQLLTSNNVDYFSAAFYLRNPLTADLGQDLVAIERRRFVGDGLHDVIVLQNQAMEPLSFSLELDVGCDFADIFSVKAYDFSLGDPLAAPPLPPMVAPRYEAENDQLVLTDAEDGGTARTHVVLSRPGVVKGSQVSFEIELQPHEPWQLEIDVVAAPDGDGEAPRAVARRFGTELDHVRDSLTAWQLRVPQLRATWDDLERSFGRSVSDLASLRMRTSNGIGRLPAAGCPWFMTVFGRDTIISCLQTLLFGSELAHSALEVLAELQAQDDDASIDAEPGKIVHEVRNGKAARKWFGRYYGTLDATPLYLVLLSEVFRWTGDIALVRDLKGPALRALDWIDRYGDMDGDGFVEYERRTPHGIVNQSWKDSNDSQRFRDGRVGQAPIAPCEVQGYVYDAKRRCAELAREIWRERALADRLEQEASVLRRRFDEAFWIDDERGGYYALALDAEKQQVDALCSNIGHLLWSGIVLPERVDAIVDQLMGDALWSGWGVRTMSSADAAFNPLSYHNGTVWPHDNSLIAWGLARYARWPEAHRIVQRMLTAARYFDYQLPEVFAGMRRSETPFPVAYPTAARPQAWASGTPVLLLQLLLGLQPDRRRHALETVAPLDIPSWAGTIRLSGVRAFDQTWDVRLEDGAVRVQGA